MDTNQKGPADISSLRLDAFARSGGGGASRGRWLWPAVAGAVIVLLVLFVAASKKPTVTVAQARPAGGAEGLTVLNASGYVTPRRKATVAAKITGRVKEIFVDEGMRVEEGQVLARLDDSDLLAAFNAATADLAVAEASVPDLAAQANEAHKTLDRYESLREGGFIDQQTLDTARAAAASLDARLEGSKKQVKAARARIAIAKQDLDNCTVRAPFAGMAVSKDAQPGEMVSPISAGGGFTRTGISTIVDMSSLEIEVDVNESYIAKVAPGQKVMATLDAYPDWQIPAAVRTVIPSADRQKATVKVRISFDKLDPRILPDMGVKVAFLAEPPAKGAPEALSIIPKEAVRDEAGAKAAYVAANERLQRRLLVLGKTLESEVEVVSGVQPGESVVISGPARLKDGERVKVSGG
ncbi:MAG: efflux RND transporter periplasmic adaptor subunit [Acidobacteria bacterium]|nr:efflux RND transporter periplasmic adaptor subunit [Acidobacteriota bacterium]